MAIGMSSYLQTDLRESLIGVLKDASPLGGNYLVGNLGVSTATQPLHQWPVFHVSRPTSATPIAEGSDATVADLSAPSKSTNYTVILEQVVKVTGTDRASNNAVNEDPMTFQKRVALKTLNAKMEYLLVNGAGISAGASGFSRSMAGLMSAITTNVTSYSGNMSMSVKNFEDMLQMSWDTVGSEYVADTVFVPMGLKRAISGLTTNVTNYVNETDRLYRNISVYDASTGVVTVVPHKDIQNAASSSTILAIRKELYRIAFLQGREPKYEELAKSGDYDLGHYITEFTLESLAEKASVRTHAWSRQG